MEQRELSKENKYYLPKETLLTVIHFCRQYPLWAKELETLPISSRAIRYDKERVQTSGDYDVCTELAMRRYEIERKMQIVRDAIAEVAAGAEGWMLMMVGRGRAYEELKEKGMPCSRATCYRYRREIYWRIAKKI